jgi:hypothetical protein
MTVAKTIMSQIRQLDVWALGAWGAKDFLDMGDGLKFKTSGSVSWKGYVYVKYDYGKDLYEVIFGRVRKLEWKVDRAVTDVFAEDLVNVIDRQVG